KEQHITITASSNLSDTDIDKAVKEAAEYEAQDKKRKEAIDTRNDADSLVFQTEKALSEAGDKIDAAAKATVEEDLKRLKELVEKSNPEVMSDGEVEDIKSAKDKLMNDAQALFAKLYEQSGAAGAAGAGPDMSGAGNAGNTGTTETYDGDVVDGDYKEV
ncbi:MAG TPA: molecular chaperone DnaK, partial [Lachnospiraceae bacterium]|nr:molecular chaperone DnaK [Lachnospiraceae bacterium]